MDDEADELWCECDGDGWIAGDCFEDTCCCLYPELEHELIPCSCTFECA